VSFLDCLNVPTVATFRDSSLYTRLADEGTGIFDIERDPNVERELESWRRLLDWIDESIAADCNGQAIRHGPQSATVHPRLDHSVLAR
jgi:hypothetical protein